MLYIFQLRFYCKSADAYSTIDIATENNMKGRQVVDWFLGKGSLDDPDDICGSYYTLPDDNSKMAADCKDMRWNMAKQADYLVNAPIWYKPTKHKHVFYFARNANPGWHWYACDDYGEEPEKAGGRWMAFIR